jgi:hypothetical protein
MGGKGNGAQSAVNAGNLGCGRRVKPAKSSP